MNSSRASPTQLMKGQTMHNHIVTLRPLEQAYPAWMKEVSPSGTRSKDGAACYDYEGEIFRLDSYDDQQQITDYLSLQIRKEHYITPQGLETHPQAINLVSEDSCILTADQARRLSAKLEQLADELDAS